MQKARWYPTLVGLDDGRVLAVSGLDDVGVIRPRRQTRSTTEDEEWTPGPKRYFPTYPALFLTKGGKLFYRRPTPVTGPPRWAAKPGIWDLKTNKFEEGPRAAGPDETETRSLLPPPDNV